MSQLTGEVPAAGWGVSSDGLWPLMCLSEVPARVSTWFDEPEKHFH